MTSNTYMFNNCNVNISGDANKNKPSTISYLFKHKSELLYCFVDSIWKNKTAFTSSFAASFSITYGNLHTGGSWLSKQPFAQMGQPMPLVSNVETGIIALSGGIGYGAQKLQTKVQKHFTDQPINIDNNTTKLSQINIDALNGNPMNVLELQPAKIDVKNSEIIVASAAGSGLGSLAALATHYLFST